MAVSVTMEPHILSQTLVGEITFLGLGYKEGSFPVCCWSFQHCVAQEFLDLSLY